MDATKTIAISSTIAWIENVVIGLNLCPFAKAVHAKNTIRYVVSDATNSKSLLQSLEVELRFLVNAVPNEIESTLLIHPDALVDFTIYNHFQELCSRLLEELELDGVVQIASFHPNYQFADTVYDDVANCTNRSPYPMLHLLRESSVSQAVESFRDIESITIRNVAMLQAMGKAKMDALMLKSQDTTNKPLVR